MHSSFRRRNGRNADFLSARFGSLTAPGVRMRPLPISDPIVYPSGIYIEIANIDRSAYIEWNSLDVANILTRQVDTAKFSFKYHTSTPFSVGVNDSVKIYDNQDLIFRGIVTKTRKRATSMALLTIDVDAVDATRELDNKVVAQQYESQTVDYIVRDIILRYAPQFTFNHVDAPITINFIRFSYQLVSECFQELAEITGYDWYVDENKDIHFGLAERESAPFELTDDSGSYIPQSITFDDDISQLRNAIYLRGGDEVGNSQTFSEVADGAKLVFPLGYHYSELPTVTDNAVAKTVGTLGVDAAASFDCLWDPTNDFIQFAIAPTATHTIAVTGTPLNPIRLYLPERTSIALYGERQYVIIDKTITSRGGARQRAIAELYKYAESLVSVRFSTRRTGLRAGQSITIDSTLFGVNDTYIVTQVQTRMAGPTIYEYAVTLVSTKLMDIVDLLSAMLTEKLKEQSYDANESFDPTEIVFEDVAAGESVTASTTADVSVTETVTGGDSVTAQALNFGITYVWGAWVPLPADNRRAFSWDISYLN